MLRRVPGSPSSDQPDSLFRTIFGIPAHHELRRLRFDQTGMDLIEWEHEELDPAGNRVARYVTWSGIDGSGGNSGYTKWAASGEAVEHRSIPWLGV
ncbi:MAG: hypothetical protein JO267_13995 [Alphaproteobacteria bacterium]|nr:hypothetical protein [Alphaproteobacteria bacterium]